MNTTAGILKIIFVLQAVRAGLHLFLFSTSPSRSIIEKDIQRWVNEIEEIKTSSPKWYGLVWLIWHYPEYRNLFYYRIKRDKKIGSRILLELAKLFFAPVNTLFIDTPCIGEGFFIQHGFSTIIAARSIGRNCWVNQQVTIGFSDKGKLPTLGDNVQVTAGAKVFGDITIGDNSLIGANAVVCKSVPPNCTVVGIPGHIVRREGKKVNECLK
jgi:serine O-acetyltransferase